MQGGPHESETYILCSAYKEHKMLTGASSEKAFHNYIPNFKFFKQNPSPKAECKSRTSKKCLDLQSNRQALSTRVVAPISRGMSAAECLCSWVLLTPTSTASSLSSTSTAPCHAPRCSSMRNCGRGREEGAREPVPNRNGHLPEPPFLPTQR